MAEIFTPEDVGAVGDGATDDSDALQAFLDQGGTFLFPGANYLTTKTVHMNGGARTLLGNGATIRHQGSGGSNFAFRAEGDGTKLLGLSVKGVGGLAEGAIEVVGDYAIVADSDVSDFVGEYGCFGIKLTGEIGGSVVKDNRVHNLEAPGNDITGDGVGMCRGLYYYPLTGAPTRHTYIQNNNVSSILGEEGDAIHIIGRRDGGAFSPSLAVVSGNTVEDASRRGIKIQGSKTLVKNNVIREVRGGVKNKPSNVLDIVLSDDVVVDGNDIFNSNHTGGISAWSASPHMTQNLQIINNRVESPEGSDKSHIQVTGGTNIEIVGNSTKGGRRGIAGGRLDRSVLADNSIMNLDTSQSGAVAVLANASCSRVTMANNVSNSTFLYDLFLNESSSGLTYNNTYRSLVDNSHYDW